MKENNGEIDHEYTEKIVCPYCGHKFSDSWEYNTDGLLGCVECDKQFNLSVHSSVHYSTSKVPCANGEGEHRWGKWDDFHPTTHHRYCKDCDKREYRRVEGAT